MRGPLPPERLRRIFVAAVTTASLVLIPWIGYLAASLPDRHVAGQWKAAWVGVDIVLVAFLAGTAWCAWRRRQLLVPAAIITATLRRLVRRAPGLGQPRHVVVGRHSGAGRAAAGRAAALGRHPVAPADPAHAIARARPRWRSARFVEHLTDEVTPKRSIVSSV